MAKLLYQKTTGIIIGVYYNVYNGTVRNYPEYIYENAMMGDLRAQHVPCRHQDEYQVFYKNRLVGLQRLGEKAVDPGLQVRCLFIAGRLAGQAETGHTGQSRVLRRHADADSL